MTKKCGNCNFGKVDGGFHKRINMELKNLEREKENKLSSIKDKDKSKVLNFKKAIRMDYDAKIYLKTKEIPKKLSICGYCNGVGRKKRFYGVDYSLDLA